MFSKRVVKRDLRLKHVIVGVRIDFISGVYASEVSMRPYWSRSVRLVRKSMPRVVIQSDESQRLVLCTADHISEEYDGWEEIYMGAQILNMLPDYEDEQWGCRFVRPS